ncbi:MAG: hypothetical protein NC331_02520 [Lachnospiraceae bacterium]|nr:hypothetical protein [Lachnospiraceae bacterium]MCM1238240.1 hypothetical protein [Lachnospiraceae bacterium]MCM1303438.1 hypothetical protein [Butyrivibrio sp.]MCM1343682.1 hypothetical protein [Muribaculaceae bacterium]MCM1410319.1 hypothetical protein [Lachnospiraceae bacterium]
MTRKTKKILWGLAFLLAAALIIAGNFFDIRVSDILIMLAMVVLLAEGIIRRRYVLILFPIAIMVIINSDRLGISRISPWSILAAALLGSIGLHVLFPHRGRHWRIHGHISDNDAETDGSGWYKRNTEEFVQAGPAGEVRLENNFGETVKYLTGGMLESVRLENNFGCMSVYFDSAELKDHTACVRAESNFGKMTLYIPAAWNVVIKGETAFGSIREKGQCDPAGVETLEVRAEVSFGEIEIRYI